VMEGDGMKPQLLRVCERLAAEGYAVAAPDLYWRFGGSRPDSKDPDAAAAMFGRLEHAAGRADIAEVVGRLRKLGASSVGITGFCMGGGYTYLAAISDVDVQAAAPFYGAGIAQHLGEPSCPLLCFFGGRDQWIPRRHRGGRAAPPRPRRRVRRSRPRVHARRVGQLRRSCGDRCMEPPPRILR
jgi:carboxymethylenebutenolidase